MSDIHWGILATGNIAAKFVEALHTVDSAQLVAVASRTQASAGRQARKCSYAAC